MTKYKTPFTLSFTMVGVAADGLFFIGIFLFLPSLFSILSFDLGIIRLAIFAVPEIQGLFHLHISVWLFGLDSMTTSNTVGLE